LDEKWRKRATQTVFGAGPAAAELMLVGEQPGDQEDRLDVAATYLTNAVKHFKWTPRAIVALGATAATALLGSAVRVTKDRGRLFDSPLAQIVTVTVHPSSILRAPDPAARRRAMTEFIDDLKKVARRLRVVGTG
jgi:DNA polymerase